MTWGTPEEVERRRRIRVAVAAYAYEVLDEPVMGDAEFDALADEVQPSVPTGNAELDKFFLENFDPFTGIWVHKHPDQEGLRRICQTVHKVGLKRRKR